MSILYRQNLNFIKKNVWLIKKMCVYEFSIFLNYLLLEQFMKNPTIKFQVLI